MVACPSRRFSLDTELLIWFVFRLPGEPRGAACPAPLSNPPGHPTTRPFGFAALLGLTGAGRTRLCEPQTCCRPSSRQPCATRPHKRDLGPCALDPLLRNQNHTHGTVELPLNQRTAVQRHDRVGTRLSWNGRPTNEDEVRTAKNSPSSCRVTQGTSDQRGGLSEERSDEFPPRCLAPSNAEKPKASLAGPKLVATFLLVTARWPHKEK